MHTQTITEVDKRSGRIRLPREAKSLFPDGDCQVTLVLKGTELTVPYRPRTGPDRERSAVLQVGREDMAGVAAGRRLQVARNAAGKVVLEEE